MQAATVGLSQTITDGTLNIRITSDACVTNVGSPSVGFSGASFSFATQASTGILGPSAQRLCIENPTNTPTWSVTLGATDGTTAVWSNGSHAFDFNDATASAADGGDTDSVGGQLSWTAGGTVAGLNSCATTGVTVGSAAEFEEGVTDAITLLSASGSAAPYCQYTYTTAAPNLSQSIPASQAGGAPYTLNMTITIS